MNNHTTKRKPYYEANEVGRKYLCRLEERRKTDYNDLSFENGKDFCSDLNKNVIRISEVKMPGLFFILPFQSVSSGSWYSSSAPSKWRAILNKRGTWGAGRLLKVTLNNVAEPGLHFLFQLKEETQCWFGFLNFTLVFGSCLKIISKISQQHQV